MERWLKSAEAYRATALLCRQQAACDPDNSWRLLGEAERCEYLAQQILASRQKDIAAEGARPIGAADTLGVAPAPSKTTASSHARTLPPKPPRLG